VLHTADRFEQVVEPSVVTGVLVAEERKYRALVSSGRPLLDRLYPSGQLTDKDYEFLRDTHGLPRDLVTELLNGHDQPGQ
jgi:alanyl-tRNA synthetase